MKKIYFIVAAIVVGIVCFTVFGSMAQQPLKRTSVVEFEGQQIRIETDKEVYTVGEPVQIKAFQKNLGNEPIEVIANHYSFRVQNSNGEDIWNYGCILLWPYDFRVMPMEEVDLKLPPVYGWQQIDNDGRQVPPGTYIIRLEIAGKILETQIVITG